MAEYNPIAVENGKRLRKIRGIRTRRGVCKELGIAYSTFSSYEDGSRNPPGRIKQKIADYYGVHVSDLFLPVKTAKSDKAKR